MAPKRRVIPVFIPHMGCPNDCIFCNQRRISGKIKPADADTVREAIETVDDACKNPMELAFYGGSFTAIPARAQIELLEAAQAFIKLHPENAIRVSTRPDCVDDETAMRLKRYGVRTIELGAQSMSDEVLRLSRRGHTARDVSHAAECIKNAGFELILQMMTGLPGDTREQSVYTAEQFIKLRPDGVRIYPTVVVRDTELFDMWQRGDYLEHTVEEAVTLCAELAGMFEAAKIPIIRLGLNPTDDLSGGTAAAGAYHPALGELVYSRVYLNKAVRVLDGIKPGGVVTIGVAKGRISMMTGQRRGNLETLRERFGLTSIKIVEADINMDEVRIISR